MHSAFRVGDTLVMASDGTAAASRVQGLLAVGRREKRSGSRPLFAALGKGGRVQMPIGKTFFSPRFGMLTDRFGVGWMVIIPQEM